MQDQGCEALGSRGHSGADESPEAEQCDKQIAKCRASIDE